MWQQSVGTMGWGSKGTSSQTNWFNFTDQDPKTLISDYPKTTGLVRLVSSGLVLEPSSPPILSLLSCPSIWPLPCPPRNERG